MSDYDKIILEMKREDDIRNANQSLLNDGVQNPDVKSAGAAAAILHTEHPSQHEKTWEEMDRTDQLIEAVELGYLNLKKSQKVAEMVDAFETAEAGFSTLSEDIDGTDEGSKQAVEALLAKDTEANRQYKREANDRAMRSAFEYQALLQESTKYRTPADIQAMQERVKDMGFWEGLGEATKLFLGGDVIGNSIYLAGSSFGAIAPYIVMAAVGNKVGALTKVASVGRAIGGAMMGYGSYQNEYGAYIAEELQKRGFDLSNPEDWKKAVRDQALIDDIKYRASNRASAVSAFDGLAGYAASLHFSPSQLTSKVRKALGKAESEIKGVQSIGSRLGEGMGNMAAQSTLQGVLGGAGEAFGSLAAGDEVNAADVLMEMLGEFTSGPLDTLSLGVSSVKEYRNDIEKAEMAMQFEKAATQFSAAAEAISNDLKNNEAVEAWADRVGEDKTLIAFGQDVIDYVDMETLKQVDPELAEEVVKAQEQKQSVEISVSRIAKIATKDRALANALIHEGKVDVAGMTPREAEEFEKTGKAEAQAQFDKILAKTKISREQLKEAREVTEELSKQLQEAGTEKAVADLQVKPWEMILANRARMLGESPKALAQRMNVRVVRNANDKAGVSFAQQASTRLPSSVNATENPYAELLIADYEQAKKTGDAFLKNVASLTAISGFSTDEISVSGLATAMAGEVKSAIKEKLVGKKVKNAAQGSLKEVVLSSIREQLEGGSVTTLGLPKFKAAAVLTAIRKSKIQVTDEDLSSITESDVKQVLLDAIALNISSRVANKLRSGGEKLTKIPVSEAHEAELKDSIKKMLSEKDALNVAPIVESVSRFLTVRYAQANEYDTWLNKAVTPIVAKGLDQQKAESVAEKFIEQMKNNLLWLFDSIPEKLRNRAKLWYEGGRKMAEVWGKRYGVSAQSCAGAIAVLSPQKGWFENVSLAERLLDLVFVKRNHKWDKEMEKTACKIVSDEDAAALEKARGATLNDLLQANELKAAAVWCRVYDETHNDPGYAILSPEGGSYDKARKDDGGEATRRWQNYGAIAKALSCIVDPRPDNISKQLGDGEKVRNFYNNIAHPFEQAYVTIDTHAVAAAALQPFSSIDYAVDQNFGGAGNSEIGVTGTYDIYHEAYNRAAKERNVLPREMQSITWEAIRVLFTPQFKQVETNKKAVQKIWSQVGKGELSFSQAQQEVLKLAGGFDEFAWQNVSENAAVSETYDRKPLLRDGISLAKTGPVITLEVAPNPDDVEKTAEWNALSDQEKVRITSEVANYAAELVLQEFEVEGSFEIQWGGFEGDTNPSVRLKIESTNNVVAIAKYLGFALKQKSMGIIADEPFFGSDPVSTLDIQVPSNWGLEETRKFFKKLTGVTYFDYQENKHVSFVDSHSTINGVMQIFNFTSLTNEDLIGKIGNVEIETGVLVKDHIKPMLRHSTLVENDQYNYSKEGTYDDHANLIQSKVAQKLEAELSSATRSAVSRAASSGGQSPDALSRMGGSSERGSAVHQEELLTPDSQGELTSLSQDRRGSYVPANTSTNTRGESGIISLMEKSDKSTFLHESAHAWLDFDTRLAMDIADKYDRGEALTEGEQEFLRTLGGFFKWGQQEGVINLGVTDDPASVMRAARAWSQMSIQDQTAMHELFANGFERYMIDGSFPNLEVKNLFQRFKKWLLDIYKSVANQPKPISNEVKKLYDLLFVSEQEVNDAEIRAGMVKLFAADDAKVSMTDEERKQYDQLNENANLEAQGIVSKAVSGVMRLYTKLRQKEAQAIYKANQKRIDKRIEELQEEPRYVALDILTTGLVQPNGEKLRYKLNADVLRAEGFDQETINTLAEKGFVYDGKEHAKFISPRKLASDVGAEDALELMKELVSDKRGKPNSPLAKARYQLSWSRNFKLNARELKALGVDDETMAKLFERSYVIDPQVKPGTCSAQQLAEASGHNFPVDLISELLDIQDVTQEATEQVNAEILQETGETPEVYTQLQADLAAHNATRSKLLHAEHNAIARMLGKKQLAIQAAREYAQQKVQGMKLNELSAYIFIRNEKKCARMAEQAYIKGDFEKCLEMKRGQILNMEMARAALEVQDRYEKSVRMARNAVKSKTIHKPFQKLATLLIAKHSITGTRGADIEAIAKDAKNLIAELEEIGTPVEGLQELIDNSTPIREMTVEEADNLCSALRELITLGRNYQKQQLLATKARIQDIVSEGKELLEEAADAQGREAKLEEVPKGKWEKFFDKGKQFLVGHIKIATWCRIFDQNKNNGFFWNLFIRSANERSDFEMTERARTAKRLSDILTPIFGNKGAFDQGKMRIGKKMMSKGERFAAACNLGNESNRKRLMQGDPEQWTDETIEQLCSSLTKADWEAVQQVWDLFESYRPMIAAKQKRVYGEEPNWIEPSSFVVQTADGESHTVRGGYYPVKYDPRSSNRADRQDDATKAAQELRGAFQSSTTNRSFVKPRVENPNIGPLRLDMTAMYNGFDDVIHDLAWHEWLIETRRVLSGVNGDGSGLRKVISERYGYHVSKAFEEWRQDIAQGSRVPGDGFGSSLLRTFSGNVGVVAMGWSPLSAIVQLTGIGYVVPRCGAKATLEALKKFITNPVKARQEINAVSDMMANRARTMNKQVAEVKSRLESGKRNFIKEHAYCMIVAVQGMVDTIAWLAAYEKAINDESVINSENPDATAIAVADQIVIDTQSSGTTHDMAAVERSEYLGPFTVFYSWSNAALNQSYAIAKGERNRVKAYRDLLWMGMFMPVLEKVLREMLKAEDEDEEDDEFAKMMKMPFQATLEYHAGLFVGARELSSSLGSALMGERVFSYGGPAGTRGIAAATQMLGNVSDPTSWGAINSAIDVVGAFTGLPAGQIKKTIKGVRAIESGQAEGLDVIKAPIFGFSGKIED